MNVLGQIIYKEQTPRSKWREIGGEVIDLSSLPQGIYIVQVKSDDRIEYEKLIKQQNANATDGKMVLLNKQRLLRFARNDDERMMRYCEGGTTEAIYNSYLFSNTEKIKSM